MSKKKIKIHQINSEILYENEVSSLKILKIIIPFTIYHFQNILKRWKKWNYFQKKLKKHLKVPFDLSLNLLEFLLEFPLISLLFLRLIFYESFPC